MLAITSSHAKMERNATWHEALTCSLSATAELLVKVN